MTGDEAIKYIESRTASTRLGLFRTRQLLATLDDPHKKLRFVHVAGTNGKGSACAMLSSVLMASGYRTGLYTSPYIKRFNERMQINGVDIPDAELARLTERIIPLVEKMDDPPSQFEVITAIAMQWFMEKGCDVVVLEVGLGGELDSTNVIDSPAAAVIMNIGLEHTEYLGNTIASVASAKAGIIKPGCPVVCYDSGSESAEVFRSRCREVGASYIPVDFSGLHRTAQSLDGQSFTLNGESYTIPLLGDHQLKNAAVVLKTVEVLRSRGFSISEAALKDGLCRTRWPARFELLRREPPFVLDGAHNPQCAEALKDGLSCVFPGRRFTMISGILRDKDADAMLSSLLPFANRVYCVTPDSPRALPAGEYARLIEERGVPASVCASVGDALRLALNGGEAVLACGSLYMAGEIENLYPQVMKDLLRRECKKRRAALSDDERERFSRQISERIAESEEYKNASVILSYRATGTEAEVRLPDDGELVAYPKTEPDGSMRALVPESADAFIKGAFGIWEPDPLRSRELSPEEIGLVICPCVGFSGRHRLGMGKGFYDRFLPKCVNAKAVAVAFETQHIAELPTQPHDFTVAAVFTEKGEYR